MNEAVSLAASRRVWRRPRVAPVLEIAVLALVIGMAVVTYLALRGDRTPEALFSPALVAALLVGNLLAWGSALVMVGQRLAQGRAVRSGAGAGGRLHARLVALFSVMAGVPILLVVVFASLLFQYGVEFWYSDQARSMIENATGVAKTSYQQMLSRWQSESVRAAADISEDLPRKLKSSRFPDYFGKQIYYRSLSDGFLFLELPDKSLQSVIEVNVDRLTLSREVTSAELAKLRGGTPSITTVKRNRIQTVVPVPGTDNLYLMTVAISNLQVMEAQSQRSLAVLNSYHKMISRSRSLQLRFNLALLLLSLTIIGIAVWVALEVADRLVAPIGALVKAVTKVEGGDLTARVTLPPGRDEIGALAGAFNQMTGRLQAQTGALESRRALIEAVMSGVSAGVLSLGADGTISVINRSAAELLRVRDADTIGRPLSQVSPELDQLLSSGARDGIVELGASGDVKTLAVRVTGQAGGGGRVLTFDDITEQLLDQRRAAWSDVARRIAHEIKNPLTPIQLAAERLQRRYGKTVPEDDTIFARLTDTIVRQVGDLRRMVDEFSSFARMPKPSFSRESLDEIARQSLFLHEVAHPAIRFAMNAPDGVTLVCDRRQLGQALTNIVKNAVEAVEAKEQGEAGEVALAIRREGARLVLEVADNGIGLPADRDRIVEPYVTTRARGTGLGLAIVKKIVEEHFGQISFTDRPGGGTIVCLTFDTVQLDHMVEGGPPVASNEDTPVLTGIGTQA